MRLLYAEDAECGPDSGSLIFGHRCPPDATTVSEEGGKFIIPTGGNFLINCLPPAGGIAEISGQIAFGW